MKKRNWIRFLWFAVLATACIIFLFSAQDGDTSSQTSGKVTLMLLRLFRPDFDSLPASQRQALLYKWSQGIRKAAHFSEFAVLGLFLHLLIAALRLPLKLPLSWLIGTLYACTDELHQTFVQARAGTWQDVGLDSAGVLFGACAAWMLLRLHRRLRSGKPLPADPGKTP